MLESLNQCHIETSKATDTGYTMITIVNYELYQGEVREVSTLVPATDATSVAPSDPASMPHPCPIHATRHKNGKKKEKNPSASGLTLEEYVMKHSPEGQEVFRQTVAAIKSTRTSGKVAQSVLDALARNLDRYSGPAVLRACQVYLAKDYASQGMRENYLLGIVRGEAKRGNGKAASNGDEPCDDPSLRWPHVWECAQCKEIHEGTKAQVGTCLLESPRNLNE